MARKNANSNKASEEQTDAQDVSEETQQENMDQQSEQISEKVDLDTVTGTTLLNWDSSKVEFVAVKPDINYSHTMIFPSEFTLPMSVVAEVGAAQRRYQIMSSTQEVPEPIIRWLKSDPRYHRWFV